MNVRVLQVNKFYYVRGGSERYLFDLTGALERAGHEVVPFAMRHPENVATPHADGFVSEVDFHAGGSPAAIARRAARFVYSTEAKRRLADLLARWRPDVAHLHNVAHQLTPSILDALSAANVPVVQTLHDYKLICSSYLLLAKGRPCERCRGGRHWQAVLTRCHHGSLGKSTLGFVEAAVHAVRGSYGGVRRFLCPSAFLRSKHASFGVADARLLHVPYFVELSRYRAGERPGEYAIYAGRLSREKGVSALIDAAAAIGEPLLVAGDGPMRAELEARADRSGANVRFLGRLGEADLHERIRDAAFVIVPSEWYENLPYAVLEAFALGKPVLGARIGGIPELVSDGETGRLFEPGDANALADAWQELLARPERLGEMGRAARALVEREHAPADHIQRVTDIYRSVAA